MAKDHHPACDRDEEILISNVEDSVTINENYSSIRHNMSSNTCFGFSSVVRLDMEQRLTQD